MQWTACPLPSHQATVHGTASFVLESPGSRVMQPGEPTPCGPSKYSSSYGAITATCGDRRDDSPGRQDTDIYSVRRAGYYGVDEMALHPPRPLSMPVMDGYVLVLRTEYGIDHILLHTLVLHTAYEIEYGVVGQSHRVTAATLSSRPSYSEKGQRDPSGPGQSWIPRRIPS